jgi:hypothetical protein
MKIKITNAKKWNWYKDLVGTVLRVKDKDKYGDMGIQVFRPDGESPAPDVIAHGHYEYMN